MVNCQEIGAIVCEKFNLDPGEFWGGAKSMRVSRPRQMAMALCRESLRATTTRIAAVYRCHHTNVVCATKRIRALEKDSAAVSAAMQELRQEIHLRKLLVTVLVASEREERVAA